MQDNDTTDRQDRNARLMGAFIILLVGLAIIWSRFAPPAPVQPGTIILAAPTPMIVETTHVDVFSHNCIGWNVNC